jgi:hypothetical protein
MAMNPVEPVGQARRQPTLPPRMGCVSGLPTAHAVGIAAGRSSYRSTTL